MFNFTSQRTKNTSSKSIEQTLQLPGSSLSRIQNPAAVVEEVGVADVAGEGVVEVVEVVEVVAEIRNIGNPLTRRLPAMNRAARRGSVTPNPMAAPRPE